MSFERDVQMFALKLEAVDKGLVPRVGTAVLQSIVEGSPVTGAPGQPVDTGVLKNSWQLLFPSADTAQIITKLEYAPYIEDGIGRGGPLRLRSPVGGFHSVALTRTNFSRLVDSVVGGRLEGWQDNSALNDVRPPRA